VKIGILGGSFNPPHVGHLILAENIRERMSLDKVIFVPANIPPLKKNEDLLDAETRLHMVNLSIKDNPYFESSRTEIERGGISFTFDTLKTFKEVFGKGHQLFFIAGSDVLKDIHLWKKIEEILKLAKFIVVTRKDCKVPSFLPKEIEIIHMEAIEISSSQIREKISRGESIRYLVPEAVRKFILKRKLYLKK
jgi:nicotinate-nucleotide adenylyltransferase